MLTLENAILRVTINPKGAELTSIFHKENGIDYCWSADAAFWGKSSPVLFPIVGALKDNRYTFDGKSYSLPRHGFARDYVFEVEKQEAESLTFLLKSNVDTLAVFPFEFEFRLRYTLTNNQLSVSYLVDNTGGNTLYFSVGGHPAFAVPLTEDTTYNDYFLEFNQQETFARWPLADGGLIGLNPETMLDETTKMPLSKELFYEDALVFKGLKSTNIVLKSDKTPHQLSFDFEGFPFLGIWAAKDANFVCIEPWCGIADSENHNQELTQKEGIETLGVNKTFERTWSVSVS